MSEPRSAQNLGQSLQSSGRNGRNREPRLLLWGKSTFIACLSVVFIRDCGPPQGLRQKLDQTGVEKFLEDPQTFGFPEGGDGKDGLHVPAAVNAGNDEALFRF
jgi:hypothetical protein